MANNDKTDGIGSNLLFLMKTPKWTNVRKKMTPAFSSGKLKLMLKLMLEGGEQLVEYVNEMTKHNRILEAREICAKFTTNTITSTSFGLEANCFNEENSPFRVVARRLYNWKMTWHAIQTTCFFLAPKLVKLFHMKFVDTFSSNFFRNVFWKTMNERMHQKVIRNDLLDILIEMRKQDEVENVDSLEGDILVAQAAQFFVAGFETTSSTMSFALLELAQRPDIQTKLRKEITHTKKMYGSFSYESLQAMEYLENTILETLRKYPIIPFLDRRCTKRYKIPGHDLVLEKGDMIFIPTMGIHNDPNYYPDPKQFDPDRFNKKSLEKRHNMTYLPFGDGPRKCIGKRFALLNAKSGLAHLLSNYEVRICDRTEKHMKLDPKGFSLQPNKGIYLEFVKTNE
ncbi:hypothetical protein WA026_008516 [Henosepilachna vigintioctopunctata]|uniref:Cytochrome P450 n=1 Tax=Henosepilachna vigintioctopunctata TaxID=420089 RepID=A0AAW1UKS8_9CUCU